MEKKLSVLIIEDDVVDFMNLERILNRSKLDVELTHSNNPERALEQIRDNLFDCVVCDYNLPGYNGLDLLIEIRKEGYHLPIIFTTGHGTEEIAVSLMKHGASDYLKKSELSVENLPQSIRRAIYNFALEKAAEQAKENERVFVSNISHELRTPINAIIGLAHLFKDTPLNEEQLDYLNSIQQSSQFLLATVNDILDLSKIKAGKLSFESHDFNLIRVIERVIMGLKHKAKDKNLPIKLKVDSKIRKTLKGDPHRLSQILYNLIGNSIKFTTTGEITVSAKLIKQDVDSSKIQFKVKDTGKGITESDLKGIFETFNQASINTSAEFGGTGLGLSICRDLVEMQGGEIRAVSKINNGATFIFTLTFANTLALENDEVFGVEPKMDLSNVKILVAEDNPLNKIVIEKILEKWNAQITLVSNGQEAVDLIIEQGVMFDVILMDIRMPVMNGYVAATKLTNHPNEIINSIPILAVTASMLDFNDEETKNCGMVDYVLKPFNPNELFAKISKQLLEKRNQKSLA